MERLMQEEERRRHEEIVARLERRREYADRVRERLGLAPLRDEPAAEEEPRSVFDEEASIQAENEMLMLEKKLKAIDRKRVSVPQSEAPGPTASPKTFGLRFNPQDSPVSDTQAPASIELAISAPEDGTGADSEAVSEQDENARGSLAVQHREETADEEEGGASDAADEEEATEAVPTAAEEEQGETDAAQDEGEHTGVAEQTEEQPADSTGEQEQESAEADAEADAGEASVSREAEPSAHVEGEGAETGASGPDAAGMEPQAEHGEHSAAAAETAPAGDAAH